MPLPGPRKPYHYGDSGRWLRCYRSSESRETSREAPVRQALLQPPDIGNPAGRRISEPVRRRPSPSRPKFRTPGQAGTAPMPAAFGRWPGGRKALIRHG